MASRKKSTSSLPDYIHNTHVFYLGIVLMISSIALVIYDYSKGESIFDSHQTQVLGEQATPTVTPFLTPTNTP